MSEGTIWKSQQAARLIDAWTFAVTRHFMTMDQTQTMVPIPALAGAAAASRGSVDGRGQLPCPSGKKGVPSATRSAS
jgi:hypothetical protein